MQSRGNVARYFLFPVPILQGSARIRDRHHASDLGILSAIVFQRQRGEITKPTLKAWVDGNQTDTRGWRRNWLLCLRPKLLSYRQTKPLALG